MIGLDRAYRRGYRDANIDLRAYVGDAAVTLDADRVRAWSRYDGRFSDVYGDHWREKMVNRWWYASNRPQG